MTKTITRSSGISPGVPWAGPLPGGGHDGKTKRLDRAVVRFAEWLRAHLPGPVQIRFNSDRLSGGAFVYPGARGAVTFDTPEIGLTARLIMPEHVKQEREKAWEEGNWRRLVSVERLDCWTEETPLSYHVLIYPQFLRFPDNLGEYKPGSRFGYWTAGTPQEAYRLLKRLVNPSLIKR